MSTEIPDKQYFKIGEVSQITGVKAHVLRYWETEFSALRPQKTRANQRLYRRKDVELLLRIKDLLYEQRFTIAGADRALKQSPGGEQDTQQGVALGVLREARRQVVQLIELVQEDDDAVDGSA